ncbi:MAG: MFS transporter [Actinomycetota bacterium]|jgi:FSR family fosmidomycin resistance protein-like MFS transporter|nr:MFS transporter [Acidimicrobiales bacterium]MEC8924255.1 MFS transporter [Actinomycetota bacterium]|tara:strand:+ start:491 stop:1630 length:1140 start_codon:yes stop_codon:yes gene_type:complete
MRSSRAVLLTFIGAHIFNDFYATVLPAFLPSLAREWDLDYAELGILSFAFSVLSGVLQPSLGHLADRDGRRRLLVSLGFLVGGCGFLAMAIAPSFWFVVVVSSLCGLGTATYHPQATAFIVEAYPNDRGRMLGLHGWGGSIGHFLAPLVATLVISAADWRWAMLLVGAPIIATSAALRLTLHETRPNPEARLRGAIGKPIITAALAFGLLSTVLYSYVTFVVKMLVDEGWADTTAGAALTSMLLIGAIAQPVGGRIYDRFGGRRLFIGATLGTIAAILVFSQTSGAISLVAVGAIAMFGFGLFPVSMAMASKIGGETRTGVSVGVVFGVTGLLGATARPAVGALAEALGDIRLALSWTVLLAVAALPFAIRLEADESAR